MINLLFLLKSWLFLTIVVIIILSFALGMAGLIISYPIIGDVCIGLFITFLGACVHTCDKIDKEQRRKTRSGKCPL